MLRYLLAEKYFDKIDVFEKRSNVGGVWNYTPGALKEGIPTSAPQLDPYEPVKEHVWQTSDKKDGSTEAVFISPTYDTLEANLPKEIMRYSDLEYPPDVQALPKHWTVKKYLEAYGEDVKDLIQFESQARDLRPSSSGGSGWTLTTENLRTGVSQTANYDAVVVASGHYDVVYIPDILGIQEWNQAYPGVISHSKFYDSPSPFQGKRVLVVGSSASAIDLGDQVNRVSKGNLLRSQRSSSHLQDNATAGELLFPEIVEFLPSANHNRAVRFADGRIESDLDAIVFCTGYLYSFPFLSSLDPPVITDGRRTVNVYEHLFYTYNPTLAFPVMTQRIIPFPFAESQAAVFARVWSGRLTLPSRLEMKVWEDQLVAEKGNGTFFHFLLFPADADAMDFLHDWAARAEKRPGLINDGIGKLPPRWGEKERWIRANLFGIRKAFMDKGESRSAIKSIAELGFDFEKWKQSQG